MRNWNSGSATSKIEANLVFEIENMKFIIIYKFNSSKKLRILNFSLYFNFIAFAKKNQPPTEDG